MISLPLARIIYAWFKGEVPDGMVVDHIDNDPFNNKIDNLQIMTQAENLEKRYIDNKRGCFNQWNNKTKSKYELAHKLYLEGKTYEEALAIVEGIN